MKLGRIDAPGIYDMPMHVYLADPCITPSLSSGLAHTLISQSPLHGWTEHCRLNPNYATEEASKFDIGTAAHEALLQGIDRVTVIDADDWRSKAAREARDEARRLGNIPLLEKHHAPLSDMVNTARMFIEGSELAGVFDDGAPEQTMIWTEGPLWFRARPDWLTADRSILLHYKTTAGSAQPDAFIRGPLANMGYDMALAFYERGLYALPGQGQDAPTSVILAQESSPPYSCSLIGLNPAMADLAASKVDRAIRLWAQCMKSGVWPSYSQRICWADPKPWQLADEEQHTYEALDPVQQREGIQA